MGVFERIGSWFSKRAASGVPGGPAVPAHTAKATDFVSQASDVPGVVVAMLERNGNVLLERRAGETPTREPCTEYLFRDPLVLTAAQHRAVKRHLTRCNPDRPMDGFSQLVHGKHGDRFAWVGSEDERRRQVNEAERAERKQARHEATEALRARIDAARSQGKIPPRPPPLTLSRSDVAGLGTAPDCDALDDLLAAHGVDVLLKKVQPDDVTVRLLDRDVLLPRALVEHLHETTRSLPDGSSVSITHMCRFWDWYAVADDDRYAELLLERLAPLPPVPP